jgi:hypothetical protein
LRAKNTRDQLELPFAEGLQDDNLPLAEVAEFPARGVLQVRPVDDDDRVLMAQDTPNTSGLTVRKKFLAARLGENFPLDVPFHKTGSSVGVCLHNPLCLFLAPRAK